MLFFFASKCIDRLLLLWQMEHSRKLAELQDGGRRLQEDMAHAVALERTRTADALNELTRVTEQKTAALLQVKKVTFFNLSFVFNNYRVYFSHCNFVSQIEAEFGKFRTTQANTPEAQLQGEITHLTRMAAELERKLAAANQAKKRLAGQHFLSSAAQTQIVFNCRFAEQWKRALHELGKVKTREQEVTKAQLRKEQHELQHMRLQYELWLLLVAKKTYLCGGTGTWLERNATCTTAIKCGDDKAIEFYLGTKLVYFDR